MTAPSEVAAIQEVAAQFFRLQMAGSWAPRYLAERGFGPAVQDQWQAGYAPAGRQALTRQLRGAGYRDAQIMAAGLARRSRYGELSDVFRDRVMFPIRSPRGTVIGFTGRAPEHAAAGVPRYLNSPATVLYDKGRALFGLWQALPALARGAVPVIVEGPLDVIAVAAATRGRYAPVAPCGTALTARRVCLLAEMGDLRATGVLVGFDGDDAGQRAAARAYPLLRPHAGRIHMADFPAGHDPAQILREHGPAALAQALASRLRPLSDLLVDAQIARWEHWLGSAEARIGALRAIAPLIAGLPPRDVARQVARLAERLGLDHPAVTEAVTDALTAHIRAEPSPAGCGGDQAGLPGSRAAAVAVSGQDCPHRVPAGTAEAAAPVLPPRPGPLAGAGRLLRGSRVAG